MRTSSKSPSGSAPYAVGLGCLILLAPACGDSTGQPIPDAPACLGTSPLKIPLPGAPTFEAYVHRAARKIGDRWIVEGDLVATSEADLRAIYEQAFTRSATPDEEANAFRSTVLCNTNGTEKTWNVAQKLNITYCFGAFADDVEGVALETAVRLFTEDATRQYERAGDVNFIRVDIDEEDCMDSDVHRIVSQGTAATCAAILDIDISETDDGCFNGFANAPGDGRNIWFFPKAFDPENPDRLRHTILHEYGHVLGLAHEHSRWVQELESKCALSAESPWRSVTDRDPTSVMAYDFCAGIDENAVDDSTVLSPRDREGIALLYNLPRTGPARFSSVTAANNLQDILWHKPGANALEHWIPTDNGGGTIEFTQVDLPYAEFGGAIVSSFPSRWRPIPVRSSDFPTSDVFLFGQGDAADLVIEQLSEIQESPALVGPFDNPIVGTFSGGTARQDIWFVSPGSLADPIVDFDDIEPVQGFAFDSSLASDGYYIGIAGLFKLDGDFSNAVASQVMWYRPVSTGSGDFRLTAQQSDLSTFLEEPVGPACFLESGREYVPFLGEFDGDSQQELFWFSPTDDEHVLWHDINAMWTTFAVSCSDVATVQGIVSPFSAGEFKPFLGDFNADLIEDIFWYRPGGAIDDLVWLFTPTGPAVVTLMDAAPDDATPLVGDYNGDGCDDILWYVPFNIEDTPTTGVEEVGASAVWRSQCNGTFAIEASIGTPLEAYPIGYNPRQGRL